MLSFKNISKINRHDKNVVYGCIRRIETLIEKQIPLVIHYMCLLFYYELDQFEYGRKEICINEEAVQYGEEPKYSCDRIPRNNLSNGDNANCSCYCIMDIMHNEYSSRFLYQWKFEYDDRYSIPIIHAADIIIGITDSSNVKWYNSNYGHHIGLSNCGEIYRTIYWPSKTCKNECYSKNTKTFLDKDHYIYPGDEITINIDIKEKTMEYILKKQDTNIESRIVNLPIVFLSRNHKYRMVTYYTGVGISVKLTEFNKVPRSLERLDDKEWINNHIKRIQQYIKH